MYVKLPSGDLNPDPCPSYTCGMTTVARVRSSN